MNKWFEQLHEALDFIDGDWEAAKRMVTDADRIFLVGNGGSAAIASHIATDYTKNGGKYAQAFNDISLLTCLANDYGHENMFARAMAFYCSPDDLLIAISSSGQSANILNAADQARDMGMAVLTLSGFRHDNPLRDKGDINFWVPSEDYGHVEITHLAILHSMV